MQKIVLAILCFSMSIVVSAQTSADVDRVISDFQKLYNHKEFSSVHAMLSPRSQRLVEKGKIEESMATLYKNAGELRTYSLRKNDSGLFYYQTVFQNMSLVLMLSINEKHEIGTFRFLPVSTFEMAETEGKADKQNSEVYLIKTSTGTLYGILEMPHMAPCPVVLIIAGSGAIDYNGNCPGQDIKTYAYKMLADSLLAAGIATVRYDKRGVGNSPAIIESTLTFDTYVNDAADVVRQLQQDRRFSSIVVAGHSEGALVGAIAAAKTNVAKYISIAGAGESIDKMLRNQFMLQSVELANEGSRVMDSIKKGLPLSASGNPVLKDLFRPGIIPFMKSWMAIEPQKEIKKLNIPTLIVQGATDLQVSEKDALNLKKAAKKGKVVIIPGMNHMLKNAPEDRDLNIATYSKPELPLNAQLVKSLVSFIKQ